MTGGGGRQWRAIAGVISVGMAVLLSLTSASAAPLATANVISWPGGVIKGDVGESVTAKATLRPAGRYGGRPAQLELRIAGEESWQTVFSSVVTSRGRLAAEVPTSSTYRGQLRFRLPAHGGKPAAISQTRRVRILEDPAVRAAEFEAAVLAQVNAARSEERWCGEVLLGPSPPLEVDDRLASAAREYAHRMGSEGFFAHVAPNGDTPSDRAEAAGYDGPVGENIAGGQGTPAAVMRSWLSSPGHCQNIMNPAYVVIGVGFAQVSNSEYGKYWVQMFGGE